MSTDPYGIHGCPFELFLSVGSLDHHRGFTPTASCSACTPNVTLRLIPSTNLAIVRPSLRSSRKAACAPPSSSVGSRLSDAQLKITIAIDTVEGTRSPELLTRLSILEAPLDSDRPLRLILGPATLALVPFFPRFGRRVVCQDKPCIHKVSPKEHPTLI